VGANLITFSFENQINFEKILKSGLTLCRKPNKMERIQVLDAGNTRVKLAVFENDTLLEVRSFDDRLKLLNFLNKNEKIVLSSVIDDAFLEELKKKTSTIFQIRFNLQLPFVMKYKTPETLGIDRICNVAAINLLKPTGNRLCVDIGTCIKFDFLHENQGYLGGSISPGLNLRFKALNSFTAKLPLLEPATAPDLIGDSTTTAIQSGVQQGMQAEINGIIYRYQQKYHDLTIFITGGDAHYFDFEQKNNIFADENLTLKGIFELYKLNATHA
jgi:type III pantothenate kinase